MNEESIHVPSSIEESANALERGTPLLLHDGSTLVKREDGVYAWTPRTAPSIVATSDNTLTSTSLTALLLTICLREAAITQMIVTGSIEETT